MDGSLDFLDVAPFENIAFFKFGFVGLYLFGTIEDNHPPVILCGIDPNAIDGKNLPQTTAGLAGENRKDLRYGFFGRCPLFHLEDFGMGRLARGPEVDFYLDGKCSRLVTHRLGRWKIDQKSQDPESKKQESFPHDPKSLPSRPQ